MSVPASALPKLTAWALLIKAGSDAAGPTALKAQQYLATLGSMPRELWAAIAKKPPEPEEAKGKAADGMVVSGVAWKKVSGSATAYEPTDVAFPVSSVRMDGCYENKVYPAQLPGTDYECLFIAQSVAPCITCQKAFLAWARQLNTTIIVTFAQGDKKANPNQWFIFPPSGTAYYLVK